MPQVLLNAAVLDQQTVHADDADALAIIVLAHDVLQMNVLGVGPLPATRDVNAVAAAVAQRKSLDLDVHTTPQRERHAPLRFLVLPVPAIPTQILEHFADDVILLLHPHRCAVTADGEVRQLIGVEHTVAAAAIGAAYAR